MARRSTTSRHAAGQPLLLLRDPGHRFSLDLAVRGAAAVESHTHQLTAAEEGDGVRVRLRDGEVTPDRDCVLTWRPRREGERAALQVFLHDDPAAAQVYFLALVAPPSARDSGRRVRARRMNGRRRERDAQASQASRCSGARLGSSRW